MIYKDARWQFFDRLERMGVRFPRPNVQAQAAFRRWLLYENFEAKYTESWGPPLPRADGR
jgi:hypothetical protein